MFDSSLLLRALAARAIVTAALSTPRQSFRSS